MQILAIRVYQENHTTKIELEKIQPRDRDNITMWGEDKEQSRLKEHLSNYFGKDAPSFRVERKYFNACETNKNHALIAYESTKNIALAPTDPGQLLKLLIAIDNFYKPKKSYACDYLSFGKESITNYIKPAVRKFDSHAGDQLHLALYHQALCL